MNEFNYKYCILKYKHSALLGESLNIGVLIYFENQHSFKFIRSQKLSRVKSIYSNVSEKLIKHYLNQIGNRLIELENIDDVFIKLEIKEDFEQFISDHVLPLDASALQFSKSRHGTLRKNNNLPIINYLKKIYLFEDDSKSVNKDYELASKFYRSIKNEFDHIPRDLFKKDYKVKNSSGVEFTFNYAWQNGSLNLVKPLNFDLQDARYISEKTHKNYGLVVDLSAKAEEQNLKFDYLVGKPTEKSLFREYEHSLNLLGSLKRVNIIEENEITDYTRRAIHALRV